MATKITLEMKKIIRISKSHQPSPWAQHGGAAGRRALPWGSKKPVKAYGF